MALNITDGRKPPDSFYRDIDIFRQISPDKLPIILEFVATYVVDRRLLSPKRVEELATKTETTEVTISAALNVLSVITRRAPTVTRGELIADLQKLEFDKETINQIVKFLETTKTKIDDYAKRIKDEAVPRLSDINWRVDIRHASGDFLKVPTIYALMRIESFDGTSFDSIYLELDKDRLSWLEATVNKIKAKFIEAEKVKEKMYPPKQS